MRKNRGKMEPTTRVELVTCRLRIVRTEGVPRNPNYLQSYPAVKS